MTYDNTNSGALFKNKDKTAQTPNWADYQGNINVDGKDYYISAWLKESKNGNKFMSLSVKPKEAKKDNPGTTAPASSFDNFDDSVPF